MWITPDKRGHTPQYGSAGFDPEDRHNKLLVLLSGTSRIHDWPHLQEGKGIVLHQVWLTTLCSSTCWSLQSKHLQGFASNCSRHGHPGTLEEM